MTAPVVAKWRQAQPIPGSRPVVTAAADGSARAILSGGETTVTVAEPDGRGGRNLEYLLGLAIALILVSLFYQRFVFKKNQ